MYRYEITFYPEIVAHEAVNDWVDETVRHRKPVTTEENSYKSGEVLVVERKEDIWFQVHQQPKYLNGKPTYNEEGNNDGHHLHNLK